MKKKKLLLRISLLALIFTLGFLWSKYYHQNLKKEKYPYRIGYIYNYTELDSLDKHAKKSLKGYYSSAAPDIYKGSKHQFREKILHDFQSQKYNDNGYLNLRFYISHTGKVFLYEAKEMNFEFEPLTFSDGLVEELIDLSLKKDNWHAYSDEDLNYYMHLTYRIENGKITEIIP
ncbi:MAG: hypothetical protein L7T62_00305 [Flavobacteriaceae bacterium]|nr:hypothetical protein [Flavobacteriaceae bacterium]